MTTTMMLLISKWIVRHFGRQYVKILILSLFVLNHYPESSVRLLFRA